MKPESLLFGFFSVAALWAINLQVALSQNSAVQWSAFSSGFAVPSSSTAEVKSSLGQPLIGSSRQSNNVVESGFLAAPLLRGPVVDVPEQENLPLTFSLSQNYPNPFNPSTTIRYELPKQSRVEIHIYNILGQHVTTVVNEEQNAGRYAVIWNGRNDQGVQVSSGVYFYRLKTGNYVATRKLTLLK